MAVAMAVAVAVAVAAAVAVAVAVARLRAVARVRAGLQATFPSPENGLFGGLENRLFLLTPQTFLQAGPAPTQKTESSSCARTPPGP